MAERLVGKVIQSHIANSEISFLGLFWLSYNKNILYYLKDKPERMREKIIPL
jgi:hypothetical protein